jgi:hypothetical protein
MKPCEIRYPQPQGFDGFDQLFEKDRLTRKRAAENSLNPSQNPFLISASQKAKVRLSFERVYDDQTEKDCTLGRAREAATSTGCTEDRASAIIRCRGDHVETDADRLCRGSGSSGAESSIQRFTGFSPSDFTHYEKRMSTLRTWMARH